MESVIFDSKHGKVTVQALHEGTGVVMYGCRIPFAPTKSIRIINLGGWPYRDAVSSEEEELKLLATTDIGEIDDD